MSTTPTATIYVPYHALDEAIDDPTIARTNEANAFTEDQTIEGNLIVTGEINPARWAEQRHKVEQLERAAPAEGVRTLLSETLTAGMSLRHEEAAGLGKVTVGNYDTQTFQPLQLEASSIRMVTGTYPPGLSESLRVHAGGLSLGPATAHATDPGIGVLRLQAVQFPATPVLSADPATLDCYQEGTWTPILGGAGGQTGQSYSLQAGLFTRIGRLLFAAFTLTLSAKGTITGELRLAGLPYPMTTAPGGGGGGGLTFAKLATDRITVVARAVPGTTTARLSALERADTTNDLPMTTADLTNTTDLRGLLVFHV